MECSIPLKPFTVIATALLITLIGGPALADHKVVIVASESSPLSAISSIDLRKIYLGIPLVEGKTRYVAIRNQSDSRLNEIFLQTLVSMSERDYERRLLTLTLQSGRRRPIVVSDHESIVSALKNNPQLVTYMWGEDFDRTRGLKVLRTLWHHQ